MVHEPNLPNEVNEDTGKHAAVEMTVLLNAPLSPLSCEQGIYLSCKAPPNVLMGADLRGSTRVSNVPRVPVVGLLTANDGLDTVFLINKKEGLSSDTVQTTVLNAENGNAGPACPSVRSPTVGHFPGGASKGQGWTHRSSRACLHTASIAQSVPSQIGPLALCCASLSPWLGSPGGRACGINGE